MLRRRQKTKTSITLLESFGTTCYVLLLSWIRSEVFFHHLPANTKTYSYEYPNFQEAKTVKTTATLEHIHNPCLNSNHMFFVVFAFTDFIAWNAAVGVDGEWRKLVYSQTPSIPNVAFHAMESAKAKTTLTLKNRLRIVFFLFLLLESFDIRENMFWRWQEDGGRRLPTRFLTMAKQST